MYLYMSGEHHIHVLGALKQTVEHADIVSHIKDELHLMLDRAMHLVENAEVVEMEIAKVREILGKTVHVVEDVVLGVKRDTDPVGV